MEPEMLKGHLDTIVLAALEAGPAHGYAIIETIRRMSGEAFDLPEGTIYPALHRLEQAGLLASAWTDPALGRRRRIYTLTEDGRSALAKRRETWGRFARAVHAVVTGGSPWPA
ncbi:PadR family transcriptional regulator [Phreatobacter aquaticus]|uniref:PadR family transcriptional regulator n=2 Tax=Phreatobacter aquaticus TaxID=2570229 RepID=A0A4D7QGK1_9HYPH|nr:PadR family transcriptional regulator [Phreatobacter aquaticus]